MEKKKKEIIWVGGLIVLITVLLNLVPFFVIASSDMWLIGLILNHIYIYYVLCACMLLPMGNIVSSVVGNRTTGFLTFVFSSTVYVLTNDVPNLIASFVAAVICGVIYDNKKLSRKVAILLSSALITADIMIVGCLWEIFTYNVASLVMIALFIFIYTVVVYVISYSLEKIPIFKRFDEKTKDLDHNYRVHSINRKLIIIINVICLSLIIIFSALSIVLLAQKENERKNAEESVWEVVLYNALSDDADIFAERDYEKIEGESEKIRDALDSGYISLPAQVAVITNIGGEYYRQLYEVTEANVLSDNMYEVVWNGEIKIDQQYMDQLHFAPSEGNSTLHVFEQSNLKDNIKNIISRIVSIALLVMVFMNVLVEKYIRKNIVRPINRMTTEAVEFAFADRDLYHNSENTKNTRVEIKSGDEIESLNQAFHKTMDDVESYIRDVHKKNKELSDMQHNIIITMADIIESRDVNTGGHIKRTALYVGIIARKLLSDGAFVGQLTPDYIQDMIVAAPLHDMGKIHVPDQILNKNGKLTDEEFGIMKSHASVGKTLLDSASLSLGDFRYLVVAKQMAESHHEWWNGNGYPNKTAGEDIPLCARIMAVADVFDALVSKRCYKEPMDLNVAFDIIEKETGTHFDPVIGRAFLDCRGEVEQTLADLSSDS